MLVAQKLPKGTNGKRFAVRETLKVNPELRQKLLDIISTDGEIAMIREIRTIMQNEQYGARNFQSQVDQLLKDGLIDEQAYRELVS